MNKSYKQRLLAFTLTQIVRVWCKPLKYILENYELVEKLRQDNKRLVCAIWHDELFPLCYLHRNEGNIAVVSASRDGELLAQVLTGLGYNLARGSSTRGGVRALLEASKKMKSKGKDAVFTVDGPRGPRHQAKEGALFLAWKTDAYLIPVRVKISCKKCFNSWDKFQLPLPGAVCQVIYGTAYKLDYKKLDSEHLALEKNRLQNKLQNLGHQF